MTYCPRCPRRALVVPRVARQATVARAVRVVLRPVALARRTAARPPAQRAPTMLTPLVLAVKRARTRQLPAPEAEPRRTLDAGRDVNAYAAQRSERAASFDRAVPR